LTNKKYI